MWSASTEEKNYIERESKLEKTRGWQAQLAQPLCSAAEQPDMTRPCPSSPRSLLHSSHTRCNGLKRVAELLDGRFHSTCVLILRVQKQLERLRAAEFYLKIWKMQQHVAEMKLSDCSCLLCGSFGVLYLLFWSEGFSTQEPKRTFFWNAGFILDWMPTFSNNERLVKAWSIVRGEWLWSRGPGVRWHLQLHVQQDQGAVKADTGLHRHGQFWSSPFI